MENVKRHKNENLHLKGNFVFTKAEISTDKQKKLERKIRQKRDNNQDCLRLINKLNRMCNINKYYEKNLITDAGKNMVANNLASAAPDTPDINLNKTAVGSGDSQPSASDTTLESEDYRRNTASSTSTGTDFNLTAFYGATEVSGTLKEHGLFANGGGSADSGVLFSRVLLDESSGGITKSNSETLTIDYSVNIN